MTISEKDRDILIKYRIEQAHEAIEESELSIRYLNRKVRFEK